MSDDYKRAAARAQQLVEERANARALWNATVQPSTWQARHETALAAPTSIERPFVELLHAIKQLAARHGDDQVLRAGLAHLINGTEILLLAPSGRLDEGLMDQRLDQLATAIDYDRATEQFKDEA
jgi:hypothetical protein